MYISYSNWSTQDCSKFQYTVLSGRNSEWNRLRHFTYATRGVYRTINNELVYCIQPGVVLSSDIYLEYDNYADIFNISEDSYNKIKLIAYYGYNYKDHKDIKWYLVTQYLIWNEIKPDTWTIYISDANKNNINHIYKSEIDEINNLVNNHNPNLGIENGYIINYKKSFVINASDDLSIYKPNTGTINNNQLILDNLNYGRNDITLENDSYNKTVFYYNSNGQNVFRRGDELNQNISTYIYVTAGKIKVNECNEEDFTNDFIGGTYEIYNADESIIETITCDDSSCVSDYLPVGFFKIKVKYLNDNYEVNDHIYDVEVKDNDVTEINICSLKKKILRRETVENPSSNEEANEEPYEYTEVDVVKDEYSEVEVPSTSKNSFLKLTFCIIILFSYYILNIKHENHN